MSATISLKTLYPYIIRYQKNTDAQYKAKDVELTDQSGVITTDFEDYYVTINNKQPSETTSTGQVISGVPTWETFVNDIKTEVSNPPEFNCAMFKLKPWTTGEEYGGTCILYKNSDDNVGLRILYISDDEFFFTQSRTGFLFHHKSVGSMTVWEQVILNKENEKTETITFNPNDTVDISGTTIHDKQVTMQFFNADVQPKQIENMSILSEPFSVETKTLLTSGLETIDQPITSVGHVDSTINFDVIVLIDQNLTNGKVGISTGYKLLTQSDGRTIGFMPPSTDSQEIKVDTSGKKSIFLTGNNPDVNKGTDDIQPWLKGIPSGANAPYPVYIVTIDVSNIDDAELYQDYVAAGKSSCKAAVIYAFNEP